jgi:multimeric flavodoxin WrbA
MNKTKTALLLIGSPKKSGSTSESLGKYLIEQLQTHGVETSAAHIHQSMKSEDGIMQMISLMNDADIIIIACPLYVDSIPAQVTRLFEFLFENRRNTDSVKSQHFAVLINCGFPESRHNNTAVRIYHRFAHQCGYTWAGGLSLGSGGAINGRSLKIAGGMVNNVKRSLELAAEALARGVPIPDEAVELMAKPMMSSWIYTRMGDWGWKKMAKKRGIKNRLHERPYE